MRNKALLFSLFAAGVLFSCQNNNSAKNNMEEEKETTAQWVNDPHTYADPNEAVVTHLNWDAVVDFENKKISATANWDIQTSPKAEKIIFDTYGLDIKDVKVDGKPADHSFGDFDQEMGKPMMIVISPGAKQVSITYETTEQARALQWLAPEQTAGKKMPFLFTQSQAILARTWIPTQDSPGIRFTYKAKVQVPDSMIALMSAENPKGKNTSGQYSFNMPQPVPSYLMALAVGDVAFEPVSDRTGVYAEPSVLDKAVYEFTDLEKMVQAAEGLYGPYAWGQYDIIVLPPSFPFGGMENPRLTFATPTILAGDRSLVALVAHELAHSWSGNLVTNATWNDFWLNEGFTVYFEQRIMEEVYGRDYSEMLASLTRNALIRDAAEIGKENPEDTKLKLNLEGRNPDEGVTSIPYDKGYFFLRLIEETVGREKFDTFLKKYFETYKFKVMTTEGFIDYMAENLLTEEQQKEIKLNEWIYSPGIPDNLPVVKSERFVAVDQAMESFIENGSLPAKEITDRWTTHEWLHFINSLPRTVDIQKLAALDQAYNLTNTGNSEIAAAWFQPAIRNGYAPANSRIENFLVNVGRRKFLTPTYKALLDNDQREMAMGIYEKARPNYHAVSRETMDELLGYSEE